MSSSGLIGVLISYKNNTKPLITRSQEARFNKDDLSCTTKHTNIMVQSNLTPASLRESMTAFTFPWYLCSLFKWTETAGMSLSERRSASSFPIFAAAATSLVVSKLDLKAFSCELAEEATVAVGVWITWALTYLFVKCIFRT